MADADGNVDADGQSESTQPNSPSVGAVRGGRRHGSLPNIFASNPQMKPPDAFGKPRKRSASGLKPAPPAIGAARSSTLARLRRRKDERQDKGASLDTLLRKTGKVSVPKSLRDAVYERPTPPGAKSEGEGEGKAEGEEEEGEGEGEEEEGQRSDAPSISSNSSAGSVSLADKLLFKRVRELVSKKKRRFKQDDFNLDLSYITDRIIAMGFPSDKGEARFRNPIDQVVRFFELRHPAKYRVYNLCIEQERRYDHSKFTTGQVVEMGFADHNPPPFSLLGEFCADAEEWLQKDPQNVVATHCKAGKGRTGTVVCCLFLHLGEFESAEESMMYFGYVRTIDGKGVTIPSQRRYVKYFERRNEVDHANPPELLIESFTLAPVPRMTPFGCEPFFLVQSNGQELDSRKFSPTKFVTARDKVATISFTPQQPMPVKGDTRFTVKHSSSTNAEDNMFHFWIHTAFVENLVVELAKGELDGAPRRDKLSLTYDSKFTVTVKFRQSA